MKKIVAFLLAGCLVLSLTACGQEPAGQTDPAEETVYPACFDGMEDLIAAARAEGALTVYGSCEESYLVAACQHFQELFGITVTYQRTAAGADVWFGGSAEMTAIGTASAAACWASSWTAACSGAWRSMPPLTGPICWSCRIRS